MEKCNNKNRDRDKNNEEPTKPNSDGSKDPTRKAYNVNDLKTLDFNSADAIRQAMKALFNDNNRLQRENSELRLSKRAEDAKSNEKTDYKHEKKCLDNGMLNAGTVDNNKYRDGVEKKTSDEAAESIIEPNQDAFNTNDLKKLNLISADDLRLKKNIIIRDEDCQKRKDKECITLTEKVDSKLVVNQDLARRQVYGDVVILDVGKDNNNDDKELDTVQVRKRQGRPPKAGPSKKTRKNKRRQTNFDFYCGKLSNLIFMKRKNRNDDDDDAHLRH